MTLSNISFGYGTKLILKSVNLEIAHGKILGILGANGAGKSTLLRLLNGRLKVKSGSVLLAGVNIDSMSTNDIARKVAIVPQNPSAAFGFTVRELVAMGRRPYHGLMESITDRDIEAIDTALKNTSLIDIANRPITELSGGETQLVFVARALAQRPSILLMDEATSSLDINHTAQILSVVRRRVTEHMLTVVSVMHDVNQAISFCDEIVFLSGDNLIGPGTPQDLIRKDMLVNVYDVDKDKIEVHEKPLYVECRI